MCEAVSPASAAISRKMGTVAVSLVAGVFFSACASRNLAEGSTGTCESVWAVSKPVKTIDTIVIRPVRMQSDCNAGQIPSLPDQRCHQLSSPFNELSSLANLGTCSSPQKTADPSLRSG